MTLKPSHVHIKHIYKSNKVKYLNLTSPQQIRPCIIISRFIVGFGHLFFGFGAVFNVDHTTLSHSTHSADSVEF